MVEIDYTKIELIPDGRDDPETMVFTYAQIAADLKQGIEGSMRTAKAGGGEVGKKMMEEQVAPLRVALEGMEALAQGAHLSPSSEQHEEIIRLPERMLSMPHSEDGIRLALQVLHRQTQDYIRNRLQPYFADAVEKFQNLAAQGDGDVQGIEEVVTSTAIDTALGFAALEELAMPADFPNRERFGLSAEHISAAETATLGSTPEAILKGTFFYIFTAIPVFTQRLVELADSTAHFEGVPFIGSVETLKNHLHCFETLSRKGLKTFLDVPERGMEY